MLKRSDIPMTYVILQYIDAVIKLLQKDNAPKHSNMFAETIYNMVLNPDNNIIFYGKDVCKFPELHKFGGIVVDDKIITDVRDIEKYVTSISDICEVVWEPVHLHDYYTIFSRRIDNTRTEYMNTSDCRIDNEYGGRVLPVDNYAALSAMTTIKSLCRSLLTLYTFVNPIIVPTNDIIAASDQFTVPRESIGYYNILMTEYINYWSIKFYTTFGVVDFEMDDDDVASGVFIDQQYSNEQTSLFTAMKYVAKIVPVRDVCGKASVCRYETSLENSCIIGKVSVNVSVNRPTGWWDKYCL